TPKLLTRFSKKKLYNYGNLLGIIPFLLIFAAYLAAPNNLTHPLAILFCFIVFLFSGASMGLTTVLQSLMIADAVDYEEYTNGTRPDAVFFSGQTFIAKLTTGIATIISGIAYSVVRFSDSRVAELNAFIAAGGIPREETHFSSFMMILFFLVSIPPAIGCILAIIPTWKYSLDDDEHKRILDVLNERRHQAQIDTVEEEAE
ncbi:MAG: MFS transporter, partial [Clostridia bacterium]|nr:MFS transporter [Clostridia bacterium]